MAKYYGEPVEMNKARGTWENLKLKAIFKLLSSSINEIFRLKKATLSLS